MAPPRALDKTSAQPTVILALVACIGAGCGDKPQTEPTEPATAKTEELAQAKPNEHASTPTPALPPAEEQPPEEAPAPHRPPPGFSVVSIHDKVPICVFASEGDRRLAPVSIEEAKKQTLRAGSSVIIGAYPPWCVNEACDQRPTLQCWTELQGTTIVVNTRYVGEHKDGSACTEACRPINAGCETPVLAAGTYTIQQGEQTWKLRIPSVLRKPCFVPEE